MKKAGPSIARGRLLHACVNHKQVAIRAAASRKRASEVV